MEGMRMNDIIAAAIHNGEPRYVLMAMKRDTFNHLQNCSGWEVVSDWNGEMGSLLVPRDQEEEHEDRRRVLGKATLAEMREGKGTGGFLAELMKEMQNEKGR